MALAISTSCCSGMLSVSTSRSASMSAPTRVEQLARVAGVAPPIDPAPRRRGFERERDVLGHRQVREQRRLLIDRGDAQRARRGRAHLRHRSAAHDNVPESAATAPVITLISVDLPAPFSPTSAWTSPCVQIERHVRQRAHAGERLRDEVRGEQGDRASQVKHFVQAGATAVRRPASRASDPACASTSAGRRRCGAIASHRSSLSISA